MKRLLLLVFAVAACSPAAIVPVAVPKATAAPTAAHTPEVVTLSGKAAGSTAVFTLSGDSYLSTWTMERDCTFYAYLRSPSDKVFREAAGMFNSDGTLTGETWIHHVGPGTYYLEVITGPCPWTVTLTEG